MNIKSYFVPMILIIFLLSCDVHHRQTQIPPVTNTAIQPSADVSVADTTASPATSIPPTTVTPQAPAWTIIDHSPAANQIRTMLIDRSGNLWTGGPAGVVHWDLETNTPTVYAIRGDPENTNVIGLLQTPDGIIWASTFGNGLAKFDGTKWQPFTTEDGLPSNYIVSQTITSRGELWFTIQNDKYSMDGHFGRLDRNQWITENGGAFDHIVALPDGSIVGTYNYPYSSGFFASTIAIYDGQKWNSIDIAPNQWIDAVTVAPDGVIWLATSGTLLKYISRTWHRIIPPWAGKDFASVSSIAVVEDGTAWFGFSFSGGDFDKCGFRMDYAKEWGVYRYDGKTWTHFTTDDGLVDNKICAITLDTKGNAWFGSFDKGVSRFDGQTWKTYAIP